MFLGSAVAPCLYMSRFNVLIFIQDFYTHVYKNVSMWLPFLVISLSGLAIKVMLALYETGFFLPVFSERLMLFIP